MSRVSAIFAVVIGTWIGVIGLGVTAIRIYHELNGG